MNIKVAEPTNICVGCGKQFTKRPDDGKCPHCKKIVISEIQKQHYDDLN